MPANWPLVTLPDLRGRNTVLIREILRLIIIEGSGRLNTYDGKISSPSIATVNSGPLSHFQSILLHRAEMPILMHLVEHFCYYF